MVKRPFNIADLFCGAGGTSTGAMLACQDLGIEARLTVFNHWERAIATHKANHPDARHYCHAIDNLNPRDIFKEGELDLLWASPECTHHSIARGGRPINDQSRATAWCVVRWAEALLPPVILVENVPEFLNWGGIGSDGRPLKHKKGKTFAAWKAALESLGYKVRHKLLCAADFGDPTTRRRLFVQAVRGRRQVIWPQVTHAPSHRADSLYTPHRWKPARDIIDWTLDAPSIYERARPLSDKTMARIMEGLEKFGLSSFIVPAQTGEKRVRSVERPLQTVTTESRGIGLAQPYIVAWDHQSGSGVWSSEDPLSVITTKARHGVAQPFLIELRGTSEHQIKATSKSLDENVSTISTSGAHHGLVSPSLRAVIAGLGEAESVCLKCGFAMWAKHDECPCCLTKPFLVATAHEGSNRSRSVEEPLPTVAGNRGDYAVCEPALLPQQSDGRLRPVSEPAPTIATAGAVALVNPYLVKYNGTGGAHSVDEPCDTISTRDRFGLVRPTVEIDGERYLLDIGFRMLQPHELAAAQGFPVDYQFEGNKTEVVKQIGNAVPVNLSRAIVRAVLTGEGERS